MFFAEVKRKYFNIIFLLISIMGGWWLSSALKPTATTNVGDFYKYNYFKPLNKAEFVYFNLTTDYQKGSTLAYYESKGKHMWGIYTKKLYDIEKEYFLYVIKKINPSYSSSEKMNDVSINMSYSEIKPYLKELEEKLHIASFYYTGMNSPAYYVKEYKYYSNNSPYRIYKECTRRFHGKKYKDALKDFMLTYQHGISNGYATVFIGIFSLLITELLENYFVGYFSYVMYYLTNLILERRMPLSILGYTHMLHKSKITLSIVTAIIIIMLSVIAYLKPKGISLVRRNENRN